MSTFRALASCGLLLVLLLPTVAAERTAQTRTVTVPFRSETWSSTQAKRRIAARQNVVVHAPKHVHASGQASAVAATASASASKNDLIGQVFAGPADEVPPDSDIAAGPNHVVATVNSVIVIYDKKGKQISQAGATSFFGSISGPGCCFDLRVLFDQTNGRFIVAAGQTDFGAPSSSILVAVSATSDPTGTWNKFAVDGSTTFWSDFPTLGISASALYIVADRIPFAPGLGAWDIAVIQMPELLAGNPNLRVTDFSDVRTSSGARVNGPIIPAITYGASDREYLVSIGPPGTLYVFSIPASGTPTLSSAALTTTPYPSPPLAPQPGSTVGLGVGGDGIFTVVSRNGSLWVSQSVGSGPGSPAANAIVRWYELDPATPAVRQLGTVAAVGNAYIPALTARPDGEVDLVYTTSSTTQFASAGYAHRNPTDPPNTMSVSGIYTPGDSDYPLNRWGDISGISVDPDGNSVWGIAEFATKGNFGTSIVQILSGATGSPSLSLSVTPATATITAGQSATFAVSAGTQALTAPVSLACTQGLPSGTSCAFSPASLSAGGSATLTITTKARSSAELKDVLYFSVFSLGGLALFTRRSRSIGRLFCCVILLAILMSCGGVGKSSNNSGGGNGGGGGTSGTPAGTYAVTVTGTSGAVNGSTTLSLVVQ